MTTTPEVVIEVLRSRQFYQAKHSFWTEETGVEEHCCLAVLFEIEHAPIASMVAEDPNALEKTGVLSDLEPDHEIDWLTTDLEQALVKINDVDTSVVRSIDTQWTLQYIDEGTEYEGVIRFLRDLSQSLPGF